MKIASLLKTTVVDYPGKVASVIFLDKCNFRCGYCHNPGLVTNIDENTFLEFENVLETLKKRKYLIDAVVITGGEPCLYTDLMKLITKLKELDFYVKLDTNGSFPNVIHNLLDKKLIDYIAMDIKAPLTKDDYERIVEMNIDINKIKESIDIIKNSGINYEFRSTIFPKIISKEDLFAMAKYISPAKKYAIQQFVNDGEMINPKYKGSKMYEPDELHEFQKKLEPMFDKVEVRGI